MKNLLGEKIRKVRELKGYSQQYMAAKLDISQRAYSKLEREETKLDWYRINDIAQILELDPIDLISFDDSLVFHNCSQSGKAHTIHNNFPEVLREQYEARLAEKDEMIQLLREENRRLQQANGQ